MKCPACKKLIPKDTLKCPHCKARTGLLCKKCNTVNSIYDLKCKKCGHEILKVCDSCGGINFPNAKKCRKCGLPFGMQPLQKLEYTPNLVSQQNAVTLLEQGLLSDSKKLFSICGEKGIGKSYILKQAVSKLKDHKFIWVFGKCTPLTQLTPGGLIQDMIFNLFNMPNFCINTPDFKKDATKFFQDEFPELTGFEIAILINFLYSSQYGKFEDLLANKKKTFDILYKVFDKINTFGKIVLIADNFDFIDGFSYEFLNNIIKRLPVRLILMYCDYKPVKGYFYVDDEQVYLDIGLAPLDQNAMNEFCKKQQDAFSYTNEFERNEIVAKSKGLPAFLEQALSYCCDCQIGDKAFVLPEDFEGIINERLKNLKMVNELAYKTLVGASILGYKINMPLLKEIFGFDDKNFKGVIDYLKQMNFIDPISEIFCEFKNILLWETILTTSKGDADFIRINEKIAETLKNFIINSNAILGIIAQNMKQSKVALDVWTNNTKLAAYVGDINLYVISQKQCLAIINEMDENSTLKIRYNIAERLGKLLSDYNPKEALDFLPDAISNAKTTGNTPKEIELLAYLAYCCLQTGNYYGNIECVDNVIEKTDDKLEKALLKVTKLKALLNIGNCGEVINLIDNDIIPILDEFLSKNYKSKVPYELVYDSWLKIFLILANALIIQGNDRSFEILTMLFDIIERNKISDETFVCDCKLALAFANTIKGDLYVSESILEDIVAKYKLNSEETLRWNLIQIINKIFKSDTKDLQEDLFKVVTFANNCEDNFTKNILKTILGKLFKDNNQAKHAIDIYNEQITYFAKEKVAIGALLTWYLIADATLITDGPHAAMEIAEQALSVAQNPKINNYIFVVLLKMVIAKACIIISDYETAKIHIENAIILARKMNLKDLLSRLYLLYGKYFQEIGLLKTEHQADYLKGAGRMYDKATEVLKKTKNNSVYLEVEKAKHTLKSFCQLNGISL